jgi:hypothetical protein
MEGKFKHCCAQARFSEPVFLLFEEKGGKLMAGHFWREINGGKLLAVKI